MENKVLTPTKPALKKEIGLMGFFCLAFGSMIGVGWVTALGGWLEQAGPLGATLAFLVGGIFMMLIGLCYAEVTSMLPLAGGEVAYAYKSYGTSKAFIVGWFLAFGYLSVSAFEAISIGKVLSYIFPAIDRWPLYQMGGDTVYGTHLILAFIFTGLITCINYRGVGSSANFQTLLTFGIILVFFVFIIAGFSGGSLQHWQPVFAKTDFPGILGGILIVLVTVPFWFVGFDTIPQSAEEAREAVHPKKLGILIIVAIVAATTFYVLLILSAAMATPWQKIIHAELPTAEAFEQAFHAPWLVNLVLVAALIGLLTSWNGFFLACSRVLFALGRGKIISGKFGETHPEHGTPTYAILFCGILTFLSAFLGRNALIAFVDVGSFCMVIAFLGVSLSLIKLRKNYPHMHRPYRIAGGMKVGYASAGVTVLIMLAMLIPKSPAALVWPVEWLLLGFIALSGLIFWLSSQKMRRQLDEKERAALILDRFV